MARKNDLIEITPFPTKHLWIKLILSVLAVLSPVFLSIWVDIRLIALLPACILPLIYMAYRLFYLDQCAVKIDQAERIVIIRKPNGEKTIPIEKIRWSAKKVGVRSPSFIIGISVDGKTIIKLRDGNWNNLSNLLALPHKNGQTEKDCIKKRNRS